MGRVRQKSYDILKTLYNINNATKAFIIDIDLNLYVDIYNEWDRAPLKKRGIDPELCYFLEECADDIPLKYPIELCFHLPKAIENSEKEKIIKTSFTNFFNFTLYLIKKEHERSNSSIIFNFAIGIGFITVAYYFLNYLSKLHFIVNILSEGAFIGGWVFLWEALYGLFFTNRETSRKKKIYERFKFADLVFSYY